MNCLEEALDRGHLRLRNRHEELIGEVHGAILVNVICQTILEYLFEEVFIHVIDSLIGIVILG